MGIFTHDDRWAGGNYELAVAVVSRELLAHAAARVWAHPRVVGPFERFDVEPDAQRLASARVTFDADDEVGPAWARYGVAKLCDDRRMPCELFLSTLGFCELAIGFPQGALDEDYGPEEEPDDPPWLPVATEWLEDMRAWLEAAVPLRIAAVGEEVSMTLDELLGDAEP